MRVKIAALGAAGNKAAIGLIEEGVLKEDRVLLINSTLKDVPDDYKRLAIELEGSSDGCGKERDLAKELCLKSLEGAMGDRIESFIEPDDELVIIISSTEGGTGSGASPVLAEFCYDQLEIPVMCFAFTGLQEDGRGLQNTIEYFQEMKPEYIVQSISNMKFLDGGSNKFKAEKAANKEFVERVKIIIGSDMVDSEQNIDDTDLYKSVTMSGYMIVGKAELNKIKNVEQFNRILTDMVDFNKSLETKKSAKRLAVISNISPTTADIIDHSYSVLKERLGNPYEYFNHTQYDPEQNEYVAFVSSGMKMPLEELKDILKKYEEESSKVDKDEDDFFNYASTLRGDKKDSMFNTSASRRTVGQRPPRRRGFNNTEKKEEMSSVVKVSKDDFVKKNY